MLAGITYLIRNWVYLSLATSVPFLLYFLYWFVLPESPRWLLTKGRFEEASRILEQLARVNGKEFPASFKQQLKQRMTLKRTKSEESLARKGPGIWALFRTPNMRLKTCLVTLNWFANETVYVGLSYYGPALGSNQYISFLLSSAVEIPGSFLCWLVIDKWGRRWPLCLCMIISGITCITTVVLPAGKKRNLFRSVNKISVCRYCYSDVNSVSYFKIDDFGVVFNYLSFCGWTVSYSIKRTWNWYFCLHRRIRAYNNSVHHVFGKNRRVI